VGIGNFSLILELFGRVTMNERVVITGIGAISPLGLCVKETWENAINGVSGVGPITAFDASDLLVRIACEVKNFNPENYMSSREVRRRDRFEQMAAAAVQEALAQSGLQKESVNPLRVGVVVSSAIGGLHALRDAVVAAESENPRHISPFAIPMLMSNGASGMIAIDYGFQGPSFSVGSACASSADGIGMAWLMLRSGAVDAMVTGGAEAPISSVGVAAFDRLGAMSRRNEDYSMTPQPFDLDRDGLVMGEGAGILILETESHAKKRGAEIIAELAGYAATADAFHITAPAEDGSGGAQAMLGALQVAGVNPDEVSYINAHGTATQLNDLSETRAIKACFGELAYNIPVSSTKSMTGHMMGATGALEAILCIKAIQESAVPPTIHYQTPDPQCDLDYTPNQAREKSIHVAISNAFGFGGHNAVLVVRKYR
jgi:3-oxoacyl-[acyl-carrier-protein] synthase II